MEGFIKHTVPALGDSMHQEGSALEQFAGAAEYWSQEAKKWKRHAVISRAKMVALGALGGAIGSLAIHAAWAWL